MTTLMDASRNFMSRPDDQRFASLTDLHAFTTDQRARSRAKVVSSRKITFAPSEDNRGLVVKGIRSDAVTNNWSFNQMAGLAGVPSKLIKAQVEKGLAPLAADVLNAGYQVIRDIEDVGLLARENGVIEIAAATGPNYGRIWNADITGALLRHFGDNGDWRVPGIFGKALAQVDKSNTTLFASDRDMFVFLADEINRITMPNRRDGKNGALARGFFVKNSEVGGGTCSLSYFLFDYVCCNRIVWGVQGFEEIDIRHTVRAPDRWLEEIAPVLLAYSQSAIMPVEAKLKAAQAVKIGNAEEFLAKRFTPARAKLFMDAHVQDEGRPVETMWDAVTAITAYARGIQHTNERIELEKEGGKLLDLVAS